MAHAEAYVSGLQEALDRICRSPRRHRLKVIPRLWLAAILARILPCLIRAILRVEGQDVDCARAEGRRVQVVRHDPAVVLLVATFQRNVLGELIELLRKLLCLLEEEPARRTVLETILGPASVHVKERLDAAEQESPE